MDADFSLFNSFINGGQRERNVFARFYDRTIKTDKINAKTNLPIFEDVCFVEIRMKDNNTDIYDQPATPEKIRRFPQEYQLYLTAKKQVETGTPLEQFAFLTGSQVATLKCHGVFTIEALSALTQEQAVSIGLDAERERALSFIKLSENNFKIDAFVKKENEYKKEISALKKQIEELKKQIEKGTK